jgi:hypothetical protein
MANKMVRQVSFLAGQVDEITWKRSDIPEYLTAAQSLFNAEVGTTGLARKRKGTTFRINVTGQAVLTSTMYEFIDKNGVYYIVLGADKYFYVYTVPNPEEFVIDYNDNYVVDYLGNNVVYDEINATLYQAIPVDYTAADLFGIDYTQDNDTLIISSPSYPPGRIFIDNYEPLHFAFEYLDIYPLPAFDFNQINYNNTTVTLTGTGVSGSTLIVQFTNMPFGAGIPTFTAAWIGGQIVGGGNSELSPIGYGIISGVVQSTTTVIFSVLVQIAFNVGSVTPYSTVGSQWSIRQPAWVPILGNPFGLGYPSKVLYYQNRLWFGNTALLPNTVFGSKTNQPISFDVGTGLDTDAIIFTIGQTNAGAIQWLNGGKQLEIYCSNYEFASPQNEEIGLTPGTFSIRQQSSYGSSTALKPQTYLNDSYFVQKTGKSLINFHFTGVGLAYASTNVAPQSQSLMKNPNNRALLRGSDVSQDNFIYLLNPDNSITAFQFATEIKLAALTPIMFTENVQLIDIVAVDNIVYILKYYSLTGQFTIESMDTGVFIDSQQNFLMGEDGLVTGLDRFNGYTVQVVYQNQDYGNDYLVTEGEITVHNPLMNVGTVQIGLIYDVEIVPMYPYYSATSSPFEKHLERIYIDYYQSLDWQINGILVNYQNFQDIQLGLPLVPQTDTAIFSPVSGYNRFDDKAIVITQSSPFDLQILAIGYQIDMAVI